MDNEQYIESGLSVGTMKIANKYEIFTEEEIDAINNKIPELDERVGIVEDEIDEINSSLDNMEHKKLDKNGILTMANMGQDVKEAMTGGSVAVVGKNAILTENIVDKQIIPSKTSFLEIKKNRFNKKTAILDKYVNADNGNVISLASKPNTYYLSDYIYVGDIKNIVRTSNKQGAFYDSSFNYVSGTREYTTPIPSNAMYFRTTVEFELIDSYQVEEGTVLTTYEDYKFLFNDEVTIKEHDIIINNEKVVNTITNNNTNEILTIDTNIVSLSKKGMLAWYNTDDLIGESISDWHDKSGNSMDLTSTVSSENPNVVIDKKTNKKLLEFSSNDGTKVLHTINRRNIFNDKNNISIFVIANKFYNKINDNQTLVWLETKQDASLIKMDLRSRRMEVKARRIYGENFTTYTTFEEGMVFVNNNNLALYETNVDYENGKIYLYQDGLLIGESELETKGNIDDTAFSRISVGNVRSGYSGGFDGQIGEIIIYNEKITDKERLNVRKYLMNKWNLKPIDGIYKAEYETCPTDLGINDSANNLALIGIKYRVNTKSNNINYLGYLYLDELTQKLYYSSGKYDNPKYLFTWNRDVADGLGCEMYNPIITKSGDIVFLRIRDRKNPIVYKYGDYENPVIVDFEGEDKPSAGLMDVGYEYDYENDLIIFGEYLNPAITGENIYLYRVTYPFEVKKNWERVLTLIMKNAQENTPNTVKHFHTVKRDMYTGHFIANTGDENVQCQNYVSKDLGKTWTLQGGGSQKFRMTGLVFTKEGAYWGNDTQTEHGLFYSPRLEDGTIDYEDIHFITWLSLLQPTYRTCLLRDEKGLLFLCRGEKRPSNNLDLLFYSFEDSRLYRVDELKKINGDTGEQDGRLGFGNQGVTAYQSTYEDGIICGATTNPLARPFTLDILGNNINDRLGNCKIKISKV